VTSRAFTIILLAMVVAALLGRIAYVGAQPPDDPTFSSPVLDGALYLERAHAILRSEGADAGAFYLAPLYGYLLAGFLGVAGERFAALYLLQHLLVVAAACLIALAGRRLVGPAEGLWAAALMLLYHPALFFASRPVGESVALVLLGGALYLSSLPRLPSAGAAGLLAGAASLARPNLLLVPMLWAAGDLARRRWLAALVTVAGLVIAVSPVTVLNAIRSGHLVPISSNGGITLYHGNAPGADGTFTWSRGFSADVRSQKREATLFAARLAGRPMDAVEADRYWATRAVSARVADPLGSAVLAGSKLGLSIANAEIGLDYSPSLDGNPWRHIAPVPFAVVLALALSALVFRGGEGSGGWKAWGAVLACAAAPWIFYVSSRYRLPAVAMLCVPAGAGAATIAASVRRGFAARKRVAILATATAFTLASLLMPVGSSVRRTEASAVASRAIAWKRAGDPARGMRELETALTRDPGSVVGWFNLGVLQQDAERISDAEASYRRALALHPGHPESAGNLAALLIRSGQAGEAVPILATALEVRPFDENCWTNLVVALALTGDVRGARAAVEAATAEGVTVEAGLVEAVAAIASPGPGGDGP